jgi:GxxExxY protein
MKHGRREPQMNANKHLAQCINYLRATDLNLCLIVNFQNPKAIWKRVVHNF